MNHEPFGMRDLVDPQSYAIQGPACSHDCIFYAENREVLRLHGKTGQVTYTGTPDEATKAFLDCLALTFPGWVQSMRSANEPR